MNTFREARPSVGLLAIVLGIPAAASAQAATDRWTIELTPYLWAAGLDGDTAADGTGSEIDTDYEFFSLDNLDFAETAKTEFGIEAVEYVNQFFKDKAKDMKYLAEMKRRCTDLGVKSLLIMCDGEGALGDADEKKRTTAVENHYRWVEAAKFLGCHSIRVNAQSSGKYEEPNNGDRNTKRPRASKPGSVRDSCE